MSEWKNIVSMMHSIANIFKMATHLSKEIKTKYNT